jgi:hypothetical protein
MSSPSSPPLILDVADRPAERWIGYGTVAAAFVLPFGALPFETHSILLAAVLLSALVVVSLRACGWLGGPHCVVHVAWLADGRWIAVQASGATAECELCLNSRIGARALWLRLRPIGASARTFSLLLSRAHDPDDQVRRLIVRLRLDVPRGGAATGARLTA